MLGSTPVVLVSGYQAVKEVLVNRSHQFSDLPITPLFTKVTHKVGISLAPYGDSWKQQRRFALSTLCHFGFGKATIADKILTEARYQIETFRPETSALTLIVSELFTDGIGTTSTTSCWGLLFMVMHPDIQTRCYEIERVVGSEQLPRMGDRRSLPYVDAMIHEIQRFGNICPLGIIRTTRCAVPTTFSPCNSKPNVCSV
ncbi:cytochrome P450 2D11-like [Petromyzon marinus]|uniref:Cytochrome P450 2D11-like n=1 Tax=Petromyzon marinus TaxID=7757 RepID=A0AAJ7WSG6_PETMA|nr:cytochrome P450 2D11-like [Petromyzon marinus]